MFFSARCFSVQQSKHADAMFCSFMITMSNGAGDGCPVPSLFFVDDELDISREENKMENEDDQDFNHPWNI